MLSILYNIFDVCQKINDLLVYFKWITYSLISLGWTWRYSQIRFLQENESFNIELSDTLESDIVFTSDVYGYIDADYVITVKEVYVYLKFPLKNFVDFSQTFA